MAYSDGRKELQGAEKVEAGTRIGDTHIKFDQRGATRLQHVHFQEG